MNNPLRLFATAATFLTRLPLARWSYAEPAHLAAAAPYFVPVGALVAAIAAVAAWLSLQWLPPALAPWAALVAAVITTGGFHEDGLADTADGLGGGFTRERKLEIMRDSRIGSYAGLALAAVLGGKYLALASLAPTQLFAALWLGHVLARWSVLPLAAWLPYAREGQAANKPVADGIGLTQVAAGSLFALLLVAPFGRLALVAAAASLIVALLAGAYFRTQLGGITGDTLGAANQVVELTCYLACAGAQRWI
ncbi:MAG: cobalamin 5'-phosphate synthase [Lysobacterales bacterium 69-70]|nr:adenosylcobinamide-GDP ribazoletransferase [Xanthomonadaceae bacterium]ODU32367.1 MAG: cobalamin 5'-phosphate synthase [Xanthomonadaceae bacterium SCN 69-320]ODV15833.1 MAG: cobalamin 5'-phosphate synthase [Xanthomonadaceae bacterium SCN 69-25]OJY95473.1 MAG: cobalamin 5'-phosphate synthase [Xanthomonadales bacterium 69-70]